MLRGDNGLERERVEAADIFVCGEVDMMGEGAWICMDMAKLSPS